jgi:hypothetical protein
MGKTKKYRHQKNRSKSITKTKTKTKTKKFVYTDKEYNSNDGMLTSVWGPGQWHFLHTMSFNYPVNPTEEDKTNYMNYILGLQYVLPCGKCRKNLKKNFKRLPLTKAHMASRETFSRYVYQLHEVVNKMLNKKSGLSYEEVRERYEHFRARCLPVAPPRDEKGCTEPLYGEKSKCVLKIVPHNVKCETMQIDNKCVKKRLTNNVDH